MPERRRDQLQKRARKALEAAREAAQRSRGSGGSKPGAGIDPTSPSTPPVEIFAPGPAPVAPPAEPAPQRSGSTPPRPRRGDARLGAPARASSPNVPLTSDQASLVELIDRLAVVADGSNLAEIELSVGETRVVVRSRASLAPVVAAAAAPMAAPAPVAPAPARAIEGSAAPKPTGEAPAPSSPAGSFVAAPLTGVFYAAPSPGAAPLVAVGQVIAAGQPIGLIEAMKLFNEIKSDKAGRVVRIVAENGRLVKAKAPIIEVEPA